MLLLGSFSRSAVSSETGARTGMAGVVTGVAAMATLLFLTPAFVDVPKVRGRGGEGGLIFTWENWTLRLWIFRVFRVLDFFFSIRK